MVVRLLRFTRKETVHRDTGHLLVRLARLALASAATTATLDIVFAALAIVPSPAARRIASCSPDAAESGGTGADCDRRASRHAPGPAGRLRALFDVLAVRDGPMFALIAAASRAIA